MVEVPKMWLSCVFLARKISYCVAIPRGEGCSTRGSRRRLLHLSSGVLFSTLCPSLSDHRLLFSLDLLLWSVDRGGCGPGPKTYFPGLFYTRGSWVAPTRGPDTGFKETWDHKTPDEAREPESCVRVFSVRASSRRVDRRMN